MVCTNEIPLMASVGHTRVQLPEQIMPSTYDRNTSYMTKNL